MNERMPEDETLFTMKESLAYLNIGRTKMYGLICDGSIEGHKVGATWRFYLRDLRKLVKSGSVTIDAKAATNKSEQS